MRKKRSRSIRRSHGSTSVPLHNEGASGALDVAVGSSGQDWRTHALDLASAGSQLEASNGLMSDSSMAEIPELRSGENMLDRMMLSTHRMDRPSRLYEFWREELVSTDALRSRILGIWSDTPIPKLSLLRWQWLNMFRQTGYVSDGQAPPTDVLTIFRGAEESERWGMSWTTDIKIRAGTH